MYARNGKCSNDDCPRSHVSQYQGKHDLGRCTGDTMDHSCGSNDTDRSSRGKANVKGRGKGERDSKGKSAGATTNDSASIEMTIRQLKLRHRWCPEQLNKSCQKEIYCPFPHINKDVVANIKASERR